VSVCGISCAICKSASRTRQTTTPAPHHSVFYRRNALPASQPTVSKHWSHWLKKVNGATKYCCWGEIQCWIAVWWYLWLYCQHFRTAIPCTMCNSVVLLLLATVECISPRQPYSSGQEVTRSNDIVTTGPCWPWQLSRAPGDNSYISSGGISLTGDQCKHWVTYCLHHF